MEPKSKQLDDKTLTSKQHVKNMERKTFFDLLKFGKIRRRLTDDEKKELDQCIEQALVFIVNCGQSIYITLEYIQESTQHLGIYNHRLELTHVKNADLKNTFSSVYITIDKAAISLYKYIENYKLNIMYSTYMFHPVKEKIPKTFNIFKGFVHQKIDGRENTNDFNIDANRVSVIVNHIRFVWCSGNEEMFNYITSWLSWLVQKPWEKLNTILIILGKQGVGKTRIIECFIKYVLGKEYGVITSDIDKVTSRFNSLNFAKILTCLDDLKLSNKTQSKRAKSLITEKNIVIERKGFEPTIESSYNNFIQLADKLEDLIDSKEMSRRSVLTECDVDYAYDTKIGKEYFDKNYKILTDETNWEHMAHWFMQRDITNFDPRNKPETELQSKLRIRSIDPILYFLKALHDGDVYKYQTINDFGRYESIDISVKLPMSELLEKFIQWGKVNDVVTKEYSTQVFSMKLDKLDVGEIIKHRFSNKVTVSSISLDKEKVLSKYRESIGYSNNANTETLNSGPESIYDSVDNHNRLTKLVGVEETHTFFKNKNKQMEVKDGNLSMNTSSLSRGFEPSHITKNRESVKARFSNP